MAIQAILNSELTLDKQIDLLSRADSVRIFSFEKKGATRYGVEIVISSSKFLTEKIFLGFLNRTKKSTVDPTDVDPKFSTVNLTDTDGTSVTKLALEA